MLSTYPNTTIGSANNRNVQWLYPNGRLLQTVATKWASVSPSSRRNFNESR
ncbi:hypothetical protein PN464_08200 [Nodularia sphaerocarpa CS-585]|nr:hypothetical protein [Nodularia sphaerocarpa]MDB9373350.1 hypothetical protein [Nodularia sphaerocarpa CS-585]MDB9378806.1 hypothetical protein [Nodularia sphaerocarpa CS-585A2]